MEYRLKNTDLKELLKQLPTEKGYSVDKKHFYLCRGKNTHVGKDYMLRNFYDVRDIRFYYNKYYVSYLDGDVKLLRIKRNVVSAPFETRLGTDIIGYITDWNERDALLEIDNNSDSYDSSDLDELRKEMEQFNKPEPGKLIKSALKV